MKLYVRYLRLCLFASGLLLGLQVPGFVEQYGSRLEARLFESKHSLNAFQIDADKYFNGDMQQLVAYYKNKPDQIIRDGGMSIETILIRNQTLTDAYRHFSSNRVTPFIHTFLQPVSDVRDNTLRSYNFMVLLNSLSIVFGLAFGLLLVLVSDLTLMALGITLRALKNRIVCSKNSSLNAS